MPYRKHLQHIKNTRLFSPRPSRASCRIVTICNTSKHPAIFSTPLRGFMPYRNHLQHIKNTRLFSQRPSRASRHIANICNTSKTPGYFLNALPGLHAISQTSATHQKHPAIFSTPLRGFTPYRKHLQHIKTPAIFSTPLRGF
jgi:hypothetical protein